MDFSKLNGLIPAVIQDERTNEVLMVGFMNEDALTRTRKSGYVTFFSRTRNTLWMKGESSGNRLKVRRSARTATRTRSSSACGAKARAACATWAP